MEREIEIRSLSGESTVVSIWPSKTIEELKLLLKQSFPPATNSPNFHLFLKGVKLSLQSLISSHAIESGEFIVLVPFTKKARPQTQQSDQMATPNQSSNSNFADSVWSDMMQDLSSLRDTSTNDNQPKFGSESFFRFKDRNEGMAERSTNDDKQECPDDLLWSILRSPSKNVLDERNSEKLIKFLESVNCLSYPYSGNCMLPREAKDEGLYCDNSSSCLCPPWLKMLMKAFAFLNILSAFLELWKKNVTLTYLKEVLSQLGKLGVQVGIADIEHLSVLCPMVVCFANNDLVDTKLKNALVIVNSEQGDQVEDNSRTGGKRKSVTNIFGAMKKRESSFKINLVETIKLLMSKKGNEMAFFFSLEELLIFVKEIGNAGNRNGTKHARKSWSSTSSSPSVHSRCHGTNQLLPVEMIEHLKKRIGSKGQIVHVEDIGARKAIHVEIPDELSDNTKSALKCIGVTKLYSHQAESMKASLAGKNVVVATMTSSGKSLCYNVPVLEELSQKLLSCALYLFPTKALAQDQLRALLAMTEKSDANINIGVYDGDTAKADRMWLRDNARLLITNPDMLHMSILPFHGQFSRILSNLRFVVIDEAHAYKGAFGCHTAVILRRLRRLCSHVYGSDPSFVFSTATSANPRDHCMELANLSSLELIQNDGSPSARKLFVLWNPISCLRTVSDKTETSMDAGKSADQKVVSRRPSPIMDVSCLFAEMVQHGLRCIAFCKTRKLCELVLCYTREILQETAPHLVDSICSYRGGYTAQDRRRIESDLFGGRLCGIAATNALELGIDVGHIDVTLHLGFPGSVASLWQQAGRSGRRERPSLAVYIAFEGPLDQYFMKFPDKLFRRPIECCRIDAQNQQVLEQHLVCAALEYPLNLQYDEKYFGSRLSSTLMSLKSGGFLSFDPSRDYSARIWHYIGHEKTPSYAVSIRAIENERYKVIDKERKKLLEEIEESKAFFQVYEGAVYMNQGKTYLVMALDVSSKVAMCQEADLNYYTKPRDYTDIHVIGGNLAYPARVSENQFSRTTAQAHNCRVTTTWLGYRCIWRGSNQVFDTVELSLPTFSYQSQAVWIQVTQSIKAAVENQNFPFRAGLHAASHAVLNVVPLCIMCNSSDLAPECANPHDTRYFPERILLYDQHPGGTGVSMQVQPLFTELLTAALDLVTSCCCSGDTGCPNCVQSLACHEYNEVLHKDAAAMIIKGVLDAERSHFE